MRRRWSPGLQAQPSKHRWRRGCSAGSARRAEAQARLCRGCSCWASGYGYHNQSLRVRRSKGEVSLVGDSPVDVNTTHVIHERDTVLAAFSFFRPGTQTGWNLRAAREELCRASGG